MRFDRSQKRNKVSRRRHVLNPDTRVGSGVTRWSQTIGVLMAKEEAQKATEEAAAEEDPSRKRALLLEALQLEQGAGRIDPGKAGSGNTGTGGYGGKVSLSDLPGSLKKSLDYDSTTSVTDFFDNLNDALVTQHRKAYVP